MGSNLHKLYNVAPGATSNVLGVDFVNVNTRPLVIEIHKWGVYSPEHAEKLQKFQRIETRHEWIEVDCHRGEIYIKESELSTCGTIAYAKRPECFKFCNSYLFPYKAGYFKDFEQTSPVIANSDLSGFFLWTHIGGESRNLHYELKRRNCPKVIFLWEQKYHVERFIFDYAALAERLTYDEFTKIIQYPQNGFGDMRMVNRAFIAHGYKDIAPTKGVDYFQNYWEERIAHGDGKLRALLLSRL